MENGKSWAPRFAKNVMQTSSIEGAAIAASGVAIASGQPEAVAVGIGIQALYWAWKTFFNHGAK